MVKIRYAELPAGLHVATQDRGECTVVYLQPGLTPAQRRAALTFARRSARIGHGPSLPPVDMALALAADRVRTASRTVIAALRTRPMLLVPLVTAVSGGIIVIMLAFVTVSTTPGKDPATDPAPRGAVGHSATALGRTSAPSGLAGASRPHSSTTPNPGTVSAGAGELKATDGDDAASSAQTPSSGWIPRQPQPAELCFAIGQVVFCLKS